MHDRSDGDPVCGHVLCLDDNPICGREPSAAVGIAASASGVDIVPKSALDRSTRNVITLTSESKGPPPLCKPLDTCQHNGSCMLFLSNPMQEAGYLLQI